MGNAALTRALVVLAVLLAAPTAGVMVAGGAGATEPTGGPDPSYPEMVDPPDGATTELVVPMVETADTRAVERSDTALVLLAVNAMLLGAGGVLLWRRCVNTTAEAPQP